MPRHREKCALFALCLVLLAAGCKDPPQKSSFREDLITAFGPVGPPAGRLAGFPFQAAQPASGLDKARRRRILDVSSQIQHTLRRSPNPRLQGELALVELIQGRVDSAIAQLEDAVAQAPRDAVLLNDLSVAYLSRGSAAKDPYDEVLALDAAGRAMAGRPQIAAACFNRALALERLLVDNEASGAWVACVSTDSDERWRSAASVYSIGALGRRSPPRHAPDFAAARFEVLENLLPTWGAATLEGDPGQALDALHRARRYSDSIVRLSDDRSVASAVRFIDQASGRERMDQAQGLMLYRDAKERCRRGEPERAAARFGRSIALLRGSISGVWAEFGLAECAVQNDLDLGAARARLESLLPRVKTAESPAFLGHWHCLLGMMQSRQGDLPGARTSFEAMTASFTSAAEPVNIAMSYHLQGKTLSRLGQERDAWRLRRESLQLLRKSPKSRGRYLVLRDAAESAIIERRFLAALDFLNELAHVSMQVGLPEDQVEAKLWRARVLLKLERWPQASRDVQLCKEDLKSMEAPSRRERYRMEILALEAELESRIRPEPGIELFAEPIAYARNHGDVTGSVALLLRRARVAEELGRLDQVDADLALSTELIEQSWRSLAAPPRADVRAAAIDLYDAQISRAIQRGDHDMAFEISERALAFWNDRPESFERGALARCREKVAQGTPILLKYVQVDEGLYVWILDSHPPRFLPLSAESASLTELSLRFRNAPALSEAAILQLLDRSYDLLIRPIAAYLPADAPLVIVPDKTLSSLPFSGFHDQKVQRFLIQDHAITLAPSATFYCQATSVPSWSWDERTDILLVHPAAAPQLPGGVQEIAALRKLYPKAKVLTGSEVRRDTVLREIDQHRALHYAGHVAVNEMDPALSRLQLSNDGRSDLLAGDLLGRSFSKLDTVILAACRSVAFPSGAPQSTLGFAEPFLVGGASTVVGTLWDVEDDAAYPLLLKFHLALRRGNMPTGALREAQMSMLREGRPPRSWAAFVVVGRGA